MTTTVSINMFEDIHHICLMYGLKQAYRRYPFFAANILATPPPFRRNPKHKLLYIGGKRNPLCVQYYHNDITILYDDERHSRQEVVEFGKAVVEEYLRLRHPYMKYRTEGQEFTEATSGHFIARID